MKRFDVLAKSATACAVVLLIAACGGGGGGSGGSSNTAASVQVSGTAATGAALANAKVAVKCASGTGTATTDGSGAYTLKLTGGALPCLIQVTGTQDGVAVTLHSLAEAGTTEGGNVTASANVTPLTEMIVAQLTATLPSDLFSSFGSGSASQITTQSLVAATNAVLSALKTATGIDLTAIDPFKAPLVAATASTAGNAYDKLLDQLGDKVGPAALPQVVSQIASGAGSGSAALGEVMAQVENGALPGCSLALSGKYRTLDFFGRTTVRDIDFRNMTYKSEDGTVAMAVSASAAKPCEFVAAGVQGGESVKYEFAMGTAGVSGYRIQNLSTGRSSVGYLFPVQAHTMASITGDWDFLQSGYMPGDGFMHIVGKMSFAGDNSVNVCETDLRNAPQNCVADDAGLSVSARTDGGFDLTEGGTAVARAYVYRSPTGALNVFGTPNPDGINTDTTEQSHFLLTKLSALTVPAVGTVAKYWDVQFERVGQNNVTTAPAADSTTVSAVESGNIVTRTRTSDKRTDRVHFNAPLPGLRYREAGVNVDGSPFAEIYQFGVNGAGFNVSINAVPTGPQRSHIYAIGMTRP